MKKAIILFTILFGMILCGANSLLAHDLTDKEILGIGDYIELRFWPDMITVDCWVGMGDIESLNYRTLMDTNKDGIVSEEEQKAFLDQLTPRIVQDKFSVELDNKRMDFEIPWGWPVITLGNDTGVKPVRVKINFPFFQNPKVSINDWHSIAFKAKNVLDKTVRLKIYVQTEPQTKVKYTSEEEKAVLAMSQGILMNPDQGTELTMSYLVLSNTVSTSTKELENFFSKGSILQTPDATKDKLLSFLTEKELNAGIIIIALLIAFFYGAAHALAPGHGKTLVAAYLVGSKGTTWDAIFLGLTVTFTHVSVVIFTGVIALVASHLVNSDTLTALLGIISGALIVIIGGLMLIKRIKWICTGKSGELDNCHSHDHGHTHDYQPDKGLAGGHDHTHEHNEQHEHPHEHVHDHHYHEHDREDEHTHGHEHGHTHSDKISLSTLLPLGISGGMLPCPAAIVVLLMAISIKRIIWGLTLIVTFSLGLASVLIIVGLLLVSGNKILQKFKSAPKIVRILSVIGPVVVTVLGVLIILKALSDIGKI